MPAMPATYMRTCWYVAAHASEITPGALLARTLLDQRVVLFRDRAGTVAALEDRCAHRLLPLSLGQVEDGRVRCGYHGAVYDGAGACVQVPGQAKIPKGAVVRSYPTAERHGFVWIWMGDRAGANDLSSIADLYRFVDEPGFDTLDGTIASMRCSYQLTNDNLFDLSHVEFVHRSTLSTEGARATRRDTTMPRAREGNTAFTMDMRDDAIDYTLELRDMKIAPAMEHGWAREFGKETWGNLDFTLNVFFRPPGFWIFQPHVTAPDAAAGKSVWFNGTIVVTPETPFTSHYFHKTSQNYRPGDRATTAYWHEQTSIAFAEDRLVLEAQQKSMGERDLYDCKIVSFDGDRMGFAARKMIRDRIAAEKNTGATTGTDE